MAAGDIKRYYERSRREALKELELRARKAMKKHVAIKEFVMAMGTAYFVCRSEGQEVLLSFEEEAENFPYAKALRPTLDLIAEWDDYLKLTGTPMRFTADGPVVKEW